MKGEDIGTMVEGYIEAAFFTADEELIPPKSVEFDATPHLPHVSHAMREEAIKVCGDFYHGNGAYLAGYPARAAGHDLWYTRNGHGCGFWEADHCTKEEGERLSESAHKLGARSLWRDDAGFYQFDLG